MTEAWFLAVPFGYLIGSVPVGLWVGRYLRGVDIRAGGSGKIGTTNALRSLGLPWAVLVLALDIGKGMLPILIVRVVWDSPTAEAIAALATLVGHIYPLYAGFRGGRAAASGGGALILLTAPAAGVAAAVGLSCLALTRIMSLSVLLAGTVGVLAQGLIVTHTTAPDAYVGFGVGAWLLVIYAHRDNIQRLRAGTERVLGRPTPATPAAAGAGH